MAGKTLTEQQKAERAVKAAVRKQVKELGPLFAEQAVAPNVQEMLLQRRMGLAKQVEMGEVSKAERDIMGKIQEYQWRRLAQQYLGEWFEELNKYRLEVLPNGSEYGCSFWADRLTTTRRIIYGYKRVEDATNSVGFRAVPTRWFPPEGWMPPLTRNDLPLPPSRCYKCWYYHEANEPCVEHAQETTDATF